MSDDACPICGDGDEETPEEFEPEMIHTVRELLHELVEASGDLDNRILIGLVSGTNSIAMGPVAVARLVPEDTNSPPFVLIKVEQLNAWDNETLEDLPTGVLFLEEPEK